MTQIFLPINAMSLTNIEETIGFFEPLKNRGLKTGLMFLILGGQKALEGESKNIQHQNFQTATIKTGPLPVIVMTSCLPLSDLDFYHKTAESIQHIKKAVDFAKEIPNTEENPMVTFHLNTLLAPEEFDESADYEKIFDEQILPALRGLSEYAKTKNISLKIETTPIPEFGDLDDPSLNTLINPYPMYSKYFPKIKSAGIGIVLDICHTAILLKELRLPQTLADEINMLERGDIIHLADNKAHQEGIALGDGEIENLPGIIKTVVKKNYKIVFEINDQDYDKGSRPNLEKTINYFLQLI